MMERCKYPVFTKSLLDFFPPSLFFSCFVIKIYAINLSQWSRKSRPLHAKGLELILKWLQDIRRQYCSLKDEAGPVLSSQRVYNLHQFTDSYSFAVLFLFILLNCFKCFWNRGSTESGSYAAFFLLEALCDALAPRRF